MKNKIQNKQKTIGMHINLNDVAVGRIAGQCGYDFIWIDLEHSYMSFETLMGHILAIKAGGTDVIVRVPQDDLTYTKKVLEMGVDGIIFPMIHNAKEANEQIARTLYPPYGTRGFGPMGAVNFGYEDAIAYVDDTVNHLCRFIQIEHIEAVEDLDEIMKNEYIDGYIFGPNDLSGSIGEICRVYEPNTTALIKKAISVLKENGKYIALATGETSDKAIEYWDGLGFDMMAAGADFGLLQEAIVKNRKNLERICKK